MIIAIASDNGIDVASLTDEARAFVLFEVAQSGAVRAGYRSGVTDTAFVSGHRPARGDGTGWYVRGTRIAETLSDCAAVIALEIDANLRRVLQGKAIEAIVCVEENVDCAAERYASSVLQGYEAGIDLSGDR